MTTNPYGQPQMQDQAYGVDPYGQPGAVAAAPVATMRPEMGFGQAVKAFFKNYAMFNGRASKSEFMWPMILVNIIGIVGYFLCLAPLIAAVMMAEKDASGAVTDSSAAVAGMGGSLIMLALYSVIMLAMLVPSLAVTARRFHDMNKSGWFVLLGLISSLIPLIWGIIGNSDPAGARFDDPSGKQPATGN